jgi:hypothetical protein
MLFQQWGDLSDEDRVMWETLGWSADNWESGDVETEGMAWNDLSADQKQAALQLSFDEDLWDEHDDDHYE